MPWRIDEKGNRYGRLLVLRESRQRSGGHVCWRCICDCGKRVTVDGNSLRRGVTISCGCYRKEFAGSLTGGKHLSKRLRKKLSEIKSGQKRVYRRDGTYYYVFKKR